MSKPPVRRQDDKSHRERWHTLQRSLLLFVIISATWLFGVSMLHNRSGALQSVFTMFAVLQGIFFFGFNCIWSKAGRQAASDLVQKVMHQMLDHRRSYDVSRQAKHTAVENRDSVVSASELSLMSIEMRRASPLGASDTSINRGPALPQVPIAQPVYTEIDIDEVIARRMSSSDGRNSTSKPDGILRGALKKPRSLHSPAQSRQGSRQSSRAVSRSNSRKKVPKKNVSWGGAVVQDDSDGGAIITTSRGGRRAARIRAQKRDSSRVVAHFPERYTLRSSWAGHGVLPDLSALSSGNGPTPAQLSPYHSGKRPRISNGSASHARQPQRAAPRVAQQRSLSAHAATPRNRSRAPRLTYSSNRRMLSQTELEPSSGLSTPAGIATPGFPNWSSHSPEPSVLEAEDVTCTTDEDSGDADHSSLDSEMQIPSSFDRRAVANGAWLQNTSFGRRSELDEDEVFNASFEGEFDEDRSQWRCSKVDVSF